MSSLRLIDNTANPAPLGLLGFGMTTVLLNIHNAGYYELNTMILAMGIFYGGMAQIIAGIMEWKKNNTFGTTAFTSYGLFWLTLVGLILMPSLGLGTATSKVAFARAAAWIRTVSPVVHGQSWPCRKVMVSEGTSPPLIRKTVFAFGRASPPSWYR